MSSSNVSLILSELQATRAEVIALKAEVSSLRASFTTKAAVVTAPAAKTEGKKPRAKNPDAPKRAPNAWIVFTKRVRDLLKANGYDAKAVGIECNQFASSLKEENSDFAAWVDADILARRASWSAPEVSKWVAAHGPSEKKSKASSAPSSVVSGDDELADEPVTAGKPKKERKNPWAGLSTEERAAKSKKMADARAAKKATSSSSSSGDAVASAVVATEDAPAASSKSAAVAASSSSAGAFRPATIRGGRYLVNTTSGETYNRLADGSQGEWAGIFHRTGHPEDNGPFIDDSVAEPSADDEELVF